MNKEITLFENWCQSSWGNSIRSPEIFFSPNTPQINQYISDFNEIPPSLKSHIAKKLIIESCSHLGSYIESGDVSWYINCFARELCGDGIDFTGRRIQSLKAALFLLSHLDFSAACPPERSDIAHIYAGGGAMVAMYLLASLEFLFRRKSRYLKDNGTIKRTIPLEITKKTKLKSNSKYTNRIEEAFLLYIYRNRTLAGRQLRILEKKLGLSKRFAKIRNPVMHGELSDPSVEARFLGLITAIIYYSGSIPTPKTS